MKHTIATFIYQFFLFMLLILLSGCVHRRHIDQQKLHINIPTTKTAITHVHDAPPITIWVHGTLILYTPSYHKIFGNTSCLLPIAQLPEHHHFRTIAETIAEHDPEHFPIEEFYIFGWSGKLKNKEREVTAEKLYQEIALLVEQYKKKYGCMPTIRIIAHSHGGNVALNMANIKSSATPFQIKSLILLACPVQEKTMHLINTPLFKRVYSLYSSFDIIQILAPQFRQLHTANMYKRRRPKYHYNLLPFSARLFPNYSHLTQAKIKIDDLPISHTHFSSKKFVSLLPTILQRLDSWHEESLINNTIAKHKLLCVYKN